MRIPTILKRIFRKYDARNSDDHSIFKKGEQIESARLFFCALLCFTALYTEHLILSTPQALNLSGDNQKSPSFWSRNRND